jgi:hypothetical protein
MTEIKPHPYERPEVSGKALSLSERNQIHEKEQERLPVRDNHFNIAF